MNFSDVIQQRYATKLFTGEKIPEEDKQKLLEYVQLSASSFGLQPYKVVVVENDELQKQLQEAAYGQKQLSTASHVLVFCAYPEITERIDQYQEMIGADDDNEYIQSMRNSIGSQDEDVQLSWSQRQLYIALGNAINGAKALGYDSCPMEGFDNEAFAKILELPENVIPTAIVTVGIAADEKPEKIRYSAEELFIHKN